MEVAAAEDSALGRGLKQSLGVLTQALRLYGEDTVVTAFNGGKDAVVVLHLMRAAAAAPRAAQLPRLLCCALLIAISPAVVKPKSGVAHCLACTSSTA